MNFFLRPGRREGSLYVFFLKINTVSQLPHCFVPKFLPLDPDTSELKAGKITNGGSVHIEWRSVLPGTHLPSFNILLTFFVSV